MATKKKMLQAAAGSATGGAGLDITDVFSTYLYEGNDGSQVIDNGINLGDFGRGTSTLFGDGAFLNRTSDLTGNSDGKTLTLSVWVFPEEDANQSLFAASTSGGSTTVNLSLDDTQKLTFSLDNSSGTRLLNLESRATLGAGLPLKAWSHVLISVDLSDTSKRHLYINDAIPSHVDWDQYNNGTVDFTQPKWGVAGSTTTASDIERMAHLYFDYTYRDLSVASNRRHFIDANGGSTSSSTQSALNPIIYLPLTEDYTTGKNLGTGGDFTINGSPTVLNTGTEYEDGYGEGGLVWTKIRTQTSNHYFWDTERGINKRLSSNQPYGENDETNALNSFNSNGFTLGSALNVNGSAADWGSAADYASWTFRKAPKFFTCLTYSGTGPGSGANEQQVSHDLGAKPGIVIIKRIHATADWWVFTDVIDGSNDYGYLNQTGAFGNSANNVATDSVFNVGGSLNTSGATYVAYLFASNDGDGEFGDGTQDIIKCGTYEGNGGTQEIDLGFEPQWVMIKNVESRSYQAVLDWNIFDNMREWVNRTSGDNDVLIANGADAETALARCFPTANGFAFYNDGAYSLNFSGDTYIYMAIRRGTKVPESGTEVFDTVTGSGVQSTGFPVDFLIGLNEKNNVQSYDPFVKTRLLGGASYLTTSSTAAEASGSDVGFDTMDGLTYSWPNSNAVAWYWKRAPGFFDAVAFSGTGVAGRTVSHNLGVVPEMMIVKQRDSGNGGWRVWHKDLTTPEDAYLYLHTSNAENTQTNVWNSTLPTSTEITLGTATEVNRSGTNYISYLFSSLDGISKVGSYTGDGTTDGSKVIDCGFSNSARFVLIKTSSHSDPWLVFDSVRGIVSSGNDPYLRLNDTSAEQAGLDVLDPQSSGFGVRGNLTNVNNYTYIFYAIA